MAWKKADKAELDRLKIEMAALRSELAAVRQEHNGIVEAVSQFQMQLKEAIDLAQQTLSRMTGRSECAVTQEGNAAAPPTPKTLRSIYNATRAALAACTHADPAEQLGELCAAMRGEPESVRAHGLLLARAVQGGLQLGELLESENVPATIARYANRPSGGTGTVPPDGTPEANE